MRYLIPALLLLHGLIHLIGFARGLGLWWLAGCFAFAAAAALQLSGAPSWWWVALLGVALSQTMIVTAWRDAKFGTLVNVLVLLPVFATVLEARPTSYRHRWEAAVREGLAGASNEDVLIREDDLAHLPVIVRHYVRFHGGAPGQPKLRNMRLVFDGDFKTGIDKPAARFHSEQVNIFDPPLRAFLMRMPMYGVPMQGLHLFQNGHATMQIQLASAMQVVDAKGPEMDQSETVTFFNDMCLFAPAALIDRGIRWYEESPLTVTAEFRGIRARLWFNESAELVDFVSEDRYLSEDGKKFERHPWSTPVLEYGDVRGHRVPARAEAVWRLPQGREFVYGKFELQSIEYNIRSGDGSPAQTAAALPN